MSKAEAKKHLKEMINRLNPDTLARYANKNAISIDESYFREIKFGKLFFGDNNVRIK